MMVVPTCEVMMSKQHPPGPTLMMEASRRSHTQCRTGHCQADGALLAHTSARNVRLYASSSW